jgi:hypothetical protein
MFLQVGLMHQAHDATKLTHPRTDAPPRQKDGQIFGHLAHATQNMRATLKP